MIEYAYLKELDIRKNERTGKMKNAEKRSKMCQKKIINKREKHNERRNKEAIFKKRN